MDQRLGSRRQLIVGNTAVDIVIRLETALHNHIVDIVLGDLDHRQEVGHDIAGLGLVVGQLSQREFLHTGGLLALDQGDRSYSQPVGPADGCP